MTKSVFHAYPDTAYFCPSYDRSQPFRANVLEFSNTTEYSTPGCYFQANSARFMHFYINMLWNSVPDGAYLTPLLFIKRNGSSSFIELAGIDIVAHSGTALQNQGICLKRSVSLNAGDIVQARPCVASGTGLTLSNAISGDGINTCNYWGGFEIG